MNLVAISTDPVATTRADLVTRIGPVPYPVLADPGGAVIRSYGLQQTGREIAVPATYVIGSDGTIVWAHISDHYTERPSVASVLEAVDAATRSALER